jgi:transcriptional antiterminator RfaH
MESNTQISSPCWYAIHTKLKQEERVAGNLAVLKVETFAPKIRERRYNEFSARPMFCVKPLFPGYVFARFDADRLLHRIRLTRGVHSVVNFGGRPQTVDDEIISVIRSGIGEDCLFGAEEQFAAGDKVKIKEGPLRDMAGIFVREVKAQERVMILLTTISYQGRLEIGKGLIEKAA